MSPIWSVKLVWHVVLGPTVTLGTLFWWGENREKSHFASINFREWLIMEDIASTYFREFFEFVKIYTSESNKNETPIYCFILEILDTCKSLKM